MAVAYVMEFDSMTSEQYRAVLQRLGISEQTAEGILHHSAGPTKDGRWIVIDVWDSAAAARAPEFYERTLPAVLRELTIAAPQRIESFDAEEVRNPRVI